MRLGPYEILAPLGAGGMGEVYRATDTRLGREVALKVLPEEFLEGEERRARFAREAKTLASLNHPNIATLYSFEEISSSLPSYPSRHVLTMELLEGESLRDVILRRTPTTRQILSWALQAAQGLSAAHQKGIVHRDIKPENLFLTTDGRIKILDFGLAKLAAGVPAETEAATVSGPSTPGVIVGTVAYMSPEQIEADGLDPRSDVFSLGVVLYELLAREHPFRRPTVPATLTAIVNETPLDPSRRQPGIPPGVDRIVRRCLEKRREERYQSAQELATALETVLEGGSAATALRDVEERSPYPGLSSFTEEDARRFFGREEEVAALWRRLQDRNFLAVIGPSGAGKTSFVRAGVVPARPEGWGALVTTPGNAPLRSLGQALAPQLAHDPDSLRKLPTVDDPEVAFGLISRWRKSHEDALLVVDQFEELFTLNPPETKARFAVLLGRLAREANVHVLLSMRDDFLMRCHEHPALASIFEALSPLGPMTRDGLRRALVEPAAKRGYRFEDETLAGEMIGAVEGARGALPLLAFAVSRLWEKRKVEEKLLTRPAYAEIGGVAGALARHAEETLDRIGAAMEPTVRDIFRNLTTAQGTRAVLDREELVSALPYRAAAEAVLGKLIDARLLTTWETEGGEGQPARHRVEIVHESLLSAWPRLVRWQTQDADGAQLRDQLRQAAHLWDERGKAEDLLWTGSSYLDYRVWRGRYPGKLSSLEEDFAWSMAALSERKAKRRRTAVASIIVALALGLGVMAALWGQSQAARQRAEASKLLGLAQLRLQEDPTEALALATASLDLADGREARLFVLKTLFEAPPALELSIGTAVFRPRFSPDGRLLATGGYMSDAHVFDEQGGPPRALSGHSGIPVWIAGRLVLDEDYRLSVWTLPDFKLEQTVEYGGRSMFSLIDSRLFFMTEIGGKEDHPDEYALWSWDPAQGTRVELGRVPWTSAKGWAPDGRNWLFARGATLLARPLPVSPSSTDIILGEHGPEITLIQRRGDQVATVNRAKVMRLWTLVPGRAPRVEDVSTPAGTAPDPAGLGRGSWLQKMTEQAFELRKRDAWTAARPLVLRRDVGWYEARGAQHPGGDWLAASTAGYSRLTFWPLRTPRPLVVDGFKNQHRLMAFSPDGRWLATSWPDEAIRLWPLASGSTTPRTINVPGLMGEPRALAFDPGGRFLFCVGSSLWVVPLDGRPPRELDGFTKVPWILAAAISPSGRSVAAAFTTGEGDRTIRVWDLETGATRAYDLPQPPPPPGPSASRPTQRNAPVGGISELAFAGESMLYSAGYGGVRRWDLASGRHEVVVGVGEDWADMAIRPDRGVLVTQRQDEMASDSGRTVVVHDLARQTSRELPAFGSLVLSGDLDAKARVLVTADHDGVIRVGRLDGGEPHLLVGHKGGAHAIISPDLKWIASAGEDKTLRLWPMPDLDTPPLHTLPRAELVEKLKSLTNFRAVRDAKSPTGWKIEIGPFPGWKNVPEW
jgi:WD40 repeat protein